MTRKLYEWAMLAALMLLPTSLMGATGITDLRVQDQVNPLAIEDLHPLFSWPAGLSCQSWWPKASVK